MIKQFLGVLGLLLLALTGWAEEEYPHVDPAKPPARLFSQAKRATSLPSLISSQQLQLSPPTDEELAPLFFDASESHPRQVGIHRALPKTFSHEGGTWRWNRSPLGGKSTIFVFSSPGAKALRLQISVYQLPDQVQLRFFNPDNPEEVEGPYSRNDLIVLSSEKDPYLFWSPVMFGETLAVEISLPQGQSSESVILEFSQLAHLIDPFSPPKQSKEGSASQWCEYDVACLNSVTWSEAANSVAKAVFSKKRGTFLCTGTLMKNNQTDSWIPYFLTANHCISSNDTAKTLQTLWLYKHSGCGKNTLRDVKKLTRGATLLAHTSYISGTDFSFLKLNETPPEGVIYAGWDVTPLVVGDSVYTIHHPSGDAAKLSYGDLDDVGSRFLTVVWNYGVTEEGSSGAPLFDERGAYVRGQLYGGTSSCSRSSSPDKFGRFDLTFSHIKSWLAP